MLVIGDAVHQRANTMHLREAAVPEPKACLHFEGKHQKYIMVTHSPFFYYQCHVRQQVVRVYCRRGLEPSVAYVSSVWDNQAQVSVTSYGVILNE